MPAEFDSRSVDRFFDRLSASKDAEPAHNFSPIRLDSAALFELKTVKKEIGDEHYKMFAEKVADDPRLTEYLPNLLLDALDKRINSESDFNTKIDTNKNSVISKAEFEAAWKDADSFDPIFRKALKFGADNFDKLLGFDVEDGTWYGNSWSFTRSDYRAANQELGTYQKLRRLLNDEKTVFEHFDTIDSNKTGKITFSEVHAWRGTAPGLSYDAYPRADHSKMMSNSAEVSKPEYQEMIMSTEFEIQRIERFWGMK